MFIWSWMNRTKIVYLHLRPKIFECIVYTCPVDGSLASVIKGSWHFSIMFKNPLHVFAKHFLGLTVLLQFLRLELNCSCLWWHECCECEFRELCSARAYQCPTPETSEGWRRHSRTEDRDFQSKSIMGDEVCGAAKETSWSERAGVWHWYHHGLYNFLWSFLRPPEIIEGLNVCLKWYSTKNMRILSQMTWNEVNYETFLLLGEQLEMVSPWKTSFITYSFSCHVKPVWATQTKIFW